MNVFIDNCALKNKALMLAGFMTVFSLWLFGHPYSGLYHDARLYAIQAMYHLHPNTYKNDLFFLYGSQDKFSIFSFIYAETIKLVGLEQAVVSLTFIGQLFWFFSAAFLLSCLSSGFVYWLALFLVTALPAFYGSEHIVTYGEPYLTPRIYAEAIVFLSLGFAFNERWIKTAGLLIVALMIHPLMTLPAIVILFFYTSPIKTIMTKRPTVVVLVFLVVAQLFWIDPFSRIFEKMDYQWFRLSLQRSPFLEFTAWHVYDWLPIIFSYSVLIICGLSAKGKLKKIFFSIIMASIFGVLLNIICVSIFENTLLLQVQTWRWLWVLHWFTYFAFAWFVGNYWSQSEIAKIVILVLFSAWTMREIEAGLISLIAIIIWIIEINYRYKKSVIRLLWIGVIFLIVETGFFLILNIDLNTRLYIINNPEKTHLEAFLSGNNRLLLIIFFSIIYYFRRNIKHGSAFYLVLLISFFLLVINLAQWNRSQSDSLPRRLSNSEEYYVFRQIIPVNSLVFWEDNNATNVWFLLERSSYISETQTAGIVFNKQTALEALRRADVIKPLNVKDYSSTMVWRGGERSLKQPEVTKYDLQSACKDPLLGFVIFKAPISGTIEVAHIKDNKTTQPYYLYDCNGYR